MSNPGPGGDGTRHQSGQDDEIAAGGKRQLDTVALAELLGG